MSDINNTPEMNEEEYDAVVIMPDDEGNDEPYDLADRIDYDADEYVVLVPQDEDDNEVVILKSVLVDDETEELVSEENEEITDAIFEEFKEMFADEYEFTDEDDDANFVDAE